MNSDFSITDLVAFARRQLAKQHRVYSRLVIEGKMSGQDADREIALMRAILDNLENQQNPKLF